MTTVHDVIVHCQKQIKKEPPPEKLLHYLKRLNRLRITIDDLRETGVGKTVNQLSRLEGEVGQYAGKIVEEWKAMVETHNGSGSDEEKKSETDEDTSASSEESEPELEIDMSHADAHEPSPPHNVEEPCDVDAYHEEDDSDEDDEEDNESMEVVNSVSSKSDNHENDKETIRVQIRSHEATSSSDDDDEDEDDDDGSESEHEDIVDNKSRDRVDLEHDKGSKSQSYSHNSGQEDSQGAKYNVIPTPNLSVNTTVIKQEYMEKDRNRDRHQSSRTEEHASYNHDRLSTLKDDKSDREKNKDKDKDYHHHDRLLTNLKEEKPDREKYKEREREKEKEKEKPKDKERHSYKDDRKHDRERVKEKYTEDSSRHRKHGKDKEKDRREERDEDRSHRSSSSYSSSSSKHTSEKHNHKRDREKSRHEEKEKIKEHRHEEKGKSKEHRYEEKDKSKEHRNEEKEKFKEHRHEEKEKNKEYRVEEKQKTKEYRHEEKERAKEYSPPTVSTLQDSNSPSPKNKEVQEIKKKSGDSSKESSLSSSSHKRKKMETSSSSGDDKERNVKKQKVTNIKIETEEIDSTSGLNFADVLGCLDVAKSTTKPKKSIVASASTNSPGGSKSLKKNSIIEPPVKPSKIKTEDFNGHSTSKSRVARESKSKNKSSISAPPAYESYAPPVLTFQPPKPSAPFLLPSDILGEDRTSRTHYENGLMSTNENMNEYDTLSSMMSSRKDRTKVYSGNKTGYVGEIPSLFNMCIRIIQENLDSLGFTGGVPYDIIKPALARASVRQLANIEFYNPYLQENTDELWKFICQRECRGQKPQELESWRELYYRCLDERQERLKLLSSKVKKSVELAAQPVRKAKLAYVEPSIRGPRFSKSKAATIKNGMKTLKHREEKGPKTGGPSYSASSGNKNSGSLNTTIEEAAITISSESRAGSAPAPSVSRDYSNSSAKMKPRKAPLMQKTLKLIKSVYRR